MRKTVRKKTRRGRRVVDSDPGHGGTSVVRLKKKIHPVHVSQWKVSVLGYGRSGVGKTTFGASMLELEPVLEDAGDKVLLLDMREEGTDSIYDQKGVDVLPVENWDDFEGAYWYLKESNHPYKGAVIDTVTQLQFLAMIEAKERAGKDPEEAMSKLSWGHLSSMLGPKLQDYRDLPLHLGILAQDRRRDVEEDDEGDDLLPEMGPAVMPSISKTLTAMVKVIGQCYIKQAQRATSSGVKTKTQFRMRVGPHPFYLTKIRSPKGNPIPASIPDPTFTKLVKIMRGEYGKKKS